MPPVSTKLKQIIFTLNAATYECQIESWSIANNTDDGDRFFTFCPDGEGREESDADYALELSYLADWTVGGISDVLTTLDGQWVDFSLANHPDNTLKHVKWTGRCKVKAPTAGGEARATERQEVTFPIQGQPIYARGI